MWKISASGLKKVTSLVLREWQEQYLSYNFRINNADSPFPVEQYCGHVMKTPSCKLSFVLTPISDIDGFLHFDFT